ncbi:hypothetical protein GGR57DRAFT_504753 [Xylariaceae sp. FL1272]|nr:hypothetical protein GGR57DRAFT_504753 [Xylariaceae sp. FL1272]
MESSTTPQDVPVKTEDHSDAGGRDVAWYFPTPVLQWPARQLLEQYSGYAPSEMVAKVIEFRDRAWDTFPFPCLGTFEFLDFVLSTRNRIYPGLLFRLRGGATFLDVGCCLGQDIRKLVFDGVPADNVVGAELRQGYIDLGYELFRDRDILPSEMYQANVLDELTVAPWPKLQGRFDVVNFSFVLHCFSRDEQVVMFERGIAALKERTLGTTIMGLASGAHEATVSMWNGKGVYIHNPESFRSLIEEVEEKTDTKWQVEVELDNYINGEDPKYHWIGPKMKRLAWDMTRIA